MKPSKSIYVPGSSPYDMLVRSRWEMEAPRLPEGMKIEMLYFIRSYFRKNLEGRKVSRGSFLKMHERLENELAGIFRERFGLVAGLEWICRFSREYYRYLKSLNPDVKPELDGIIPTEDFVKSEIFDGIEVFSPRITLMRFEEYDQHMKSAERSLEEAEARRREGDAYFTELDRAISYSPEENVNSDGRLEKEAS